MSLKAGSNSDLGLTAPPVREISMTGSDTLNENLSMVSEEDEKRTTAAANPNKNNDRQQQQQKTRIPYPQRPYFRYAIALWIFQLILVVALKRFGILKLHDPLVELNDAVLEQFHTVLPAINESIGSLTNGMTAGMVSSNEKSRNVGRELKEEGAEASLPIVMVPGFVTSALEVWSGRECSNGFFRQRIWAALTGAASFLVERDCWKEHMMLDPYTGGDPDGIRVRASEGFAATDFFLLNYWVWDRLVDNLAVVGYTPSNMVMEPYDWRLPFHLLEERDGYFTKLKARIEALHKTTGKKVVLATHSMGAMVMHHFFGWVTTRERDGGGGGGRKWVDKHIDTYINIAGSHLGVPKAATALLSGEMSDTVFAGRMAKMAERFFGRRKRQNLWSSWGSLWAMLPKGGNQLWGPGSDFCTERDTNDTLCPSSPDNDALSPLIALEGSIDEDEENFDFVNATEDVKPLLERLVRRGSHKTEDVLDFLLHYGSGLGPDTVGSKFHSQYGEDKDKSRVWYDATRSPLPHAPNMKIYCLYGTGLPTERAYYYKRNWQEDITLESDASKRSIAEPAIIIDETMNDEDRNISYGVKYGDGDGSVPLLSLGYICSDAWRRKDSGLNPSGAPVYTREYKHKSEFCVDDPMRGGPSSSDHVDILGNAGMMEDFIKIVTQHDTEAVASDRIVSNIREIAQQINSHPSGGVFKGKR